VNFGVCGAAGFSIRPAAFFCKATMGLAPNHAKAIAPSTFARRNAVGHFPSADNCLDDDAAFGLRILKICLLGALARE
jgi:hypothetical protein